MKASNRRFIVPIVMPLLLFMSFNRSIAAGSTVPTGVPDNSLDDSTKAVLVLIKTDGVFDAALKEMDAGNSRRGSYKAASRALLNSDYMQSVIAALREHGEIANRYEARSTSPEFESEVPYFYFFLNGVTMNVNPGKLDEIASLPFVKGIIDCDAKFEFPANSSFMRTGDETYSTWEELVNGNSLYIKTSGVDDMHAMGYYGRGRMIAVIDTGIDDDHPLVNLVYNTHMWAQGKLNVAGASFYPEDGDTVNDDSVDGHGTADAGAAWLSSRDADFYICEVPTGGVANALVAGRMIFQLNAAKTAGADVIVTSFAPALAAALCNWQSSSLCIAFQAGVDGMTSILAAAGNAPDENPDLVPGSPSAAPSVLAISSVRFSYPGWAVFEAGCPIAACEQKPDLAAPGSSVRTISNNGSWGYGSGSSIAAPFAAGIIAALLDLESDHRILEQAAFESADVVPDDDAGLTGRGAINALNTMCYLLGDWTAPSVTNMKANATEVLAGSTVSRYVGETILIEGTAADNVHISRFQLSIGSEVAQEAGPFGDQDAALSFNWNSANMLPGEYVVGFDAYDGCGGHVYEHFVIDLQLPPPDPVLAVTPSILSFASAQGQDPAEQYLSIQNVGRGTLNWTATTNDPRVVVDPSSGAAPSTPRVTINSTNFDVGTWSRVITIAAPGAIGSPATTQVSYVVTSNVGGESRPAIEDVYLDENFTFCNTGSATTLRVGSADQFDRYLSYVKFNVSDLQGADIVAAKLRLYCTDFRTEIPIEVRRLVSDWDEGDDCIALSDNHQTTGTTYTEVIDGTGWFEWDVVDIVRSWAAGEANVGVLISPDSVEANQYNTFSSRTGGYPPALVVTLCEGTPNLYVSVPRPDNGATAPPFTVGQEVRWYVTVSNQGMGCAPRYDVDYYLENGPSTLANLIGSDDGLGLIGGATREESHRYTFTAGDMGSQKYLVAHLRGTSRKAVYGPFEVRDNTPCSLTVTQPADGDHWALGSTQAITWTTGNCGAFVRIELLRDSVPCRIIANSTENDGLYEFEAARCGDNVDGYSVRVIDLTSGNFGTSAGQFEIRFYPFTDINAGLLGGSESSVSWGDYDNDGDLDILYAGDSSVLGHLSVVYQNSGGANPTFPFPLWEWVGGFWMYYDGVVEGDAAWGDYDNDGDLDVLLTGKLWGADTYISKVFRNSGGENPTFTDIGAGLIGVGYSSVSWGDYDNDGDLDILLAGVGGSNIISRVYRNSGGENPTFTDIGAGLDGVLMSSVSWGDYDNDGNLDILLAGGTASDNISKVYRNTGGENPTFTDIGAGLPGVLRGSVSWGDYDNDGNLDILLTGRTSSGSISKVYRNSGGENPTFTDIGAGLPGVTASSASWGDYDNDGNLDILLTGDTGSERISRIYRNSGGTHPTFTDIAAGLAGVAAMRTTGSSAWGDYDNDGDLDVLIAGFGESGHIAKIYKNNSALTNTPPAVPGDLSASVAIDLATLSWSAATDAETPAAGLSYNLRVGTTPGGNEISAAMADRTSGYRHVVALGNAQQRTSWTLTLPPGTYYWSVQAIDGAWAGSEFAPEQSFVVEQPPASIEFTDIGAGLSGVSRAGVAWGDYDNDGDLDILTTGDTGEGCIARIYRNSGGATPTFTVATFAPFLDGVCDAFVAWGDYDNDGDLDVLLIGIRNGEAITTIYRNLGGVNPAFIDVQAGFGNVYGDRGAWGDYDNDGDLDLLLAGTDDFGPITRIYRNSGGENPTFADIGADIVGVSTSSSVAWGDYDRDGDLDFLLAGHTGSDLISMIYRNSGGANPAFTGVEAGLTGVYIASAAWGDYDNDGDLDILLSGRIGTADICKIYRNSGGMNPMFDDIGAGLSGVSGSVAWGDCDNDGYLDILLAGESYVPDHYTGPVAKIYRNSGGASPTFTDIGAGLTGVHYGSAAWGDYDIDGDLDILLVGDSGSNYISKIYRNTGAPTNTRPAVPVDLSASAASQRATMSWNAATDAETPTSGLSYNLRIGTTPGGNEITSAMSDGSSGYRRVVGLGNAQQRTSWTLTLPPGTYYWSVQAIDGAWTGSPFAPEQSFVVEPPAPIAFTDRGAGLIGFASGSAAWGDYDNDGDLDVLLVGAGTGHVSKIYRNWGGANPTFTDTWVDLTGVWRASAAWGDYDSDGDLDILLAGISISAGTPISRIYRNSGGASPAFLDIGAGLAGVSHASVAWGDCDNDGDLDILLAGSSVSGAISKVYRNSGGPNPTFVDIAAGLTGVSHASVAWGDCDNDGDLDILLAGSSVSGAISKIYRNSGGANPTFVDIAAGLTGVSSASVAWGDCDSDGDLDILLTGLDPAANPVTKIYRSSGGASPTFVDHAAGLIGVSSGSAAWGDYDNDGDLDILLAGSSASGRTAKVYQNSGGANPTFVDVEPDLTAVQDASVAWGDYDNDGDLDFLLTGSSSSGYISRIYESTNAPTNLPPEVPGALMAEWSPTAGSVFSWTAPRDDRTPASGLTYNLRVGTTPGGDQVSSAMASAGGYRHVVAPGNAQQRTSWTLALSSGTYYWSVQAVDGAWAGSAFAPEQVLFVGQFVEVGTGLTGLGSGSVAWGDYDNDGDLDIILTGWGGGSTVAKVCTNTNGAFSDIGAELTGVQYSSVAWGDYDNDGDLDILLTGQNIGGGAVAKVYANTNGTFSDIGAGLTGVWNASVAWGDYDNDGDLDILLTGWDGGSPVAKVFANTDGAFSDIGAGLTGVRYSSIAWGDYDNDGDLDILLTGQNIGGGAVAKVYANTNGTFSDIGAGLTGVWNASVAWGDYDSDGDLDILLTGWDGGGPVAKVYRNAVGVFSDIGAGLAGVSTSAAAWGDYDNDGDLDIILAGLSSGFLMTTNVYENADGAFLDIGAGFAKVWGPSIAWGDFDNDDDLDVLFTGWEGGTPITKVYENHRAAPNTSPATPGNLAAVAAEGTMTFSWDAATDSETPSSGLSYNLRIGTTIGGNQITTAMSDGASGYRRVVALGNAQQRTSWTLALPPGIYYWSVQAMDGVWAGSAFAPEQIIGIATAVTEQALPTKHALRGIAPNPFNPITTVAFDLPQPEQVRLAVFDMSGRLVRFLVDEERAAGRHEVVWNGLNDHGLQVASGVYFCRMEAGPFRETRRMTLLK